LGVYGTFGSEGLAFYQKYPPHFYEGSDSKSSEIANLSIVPYRATIAQPILDLLSEKGQSDPSPAEFRPLRALTDLTPAAVMPVLRLSNGDDILYAELLRVIHTAGSLPPHPQTIHVTVFAEWDTLYGRALSETFSALAAHGLPSPVDDRFYYPALMEDLEKGLLARHPPVSVAAAGGRIQVTVIPYLRGLDGAFSLYGVNYGGTSAGLLATLVRSTNQYHSVEAMLLPSERGS
jgi:hypothetical protein